MQSCSKYGQIDPWLILGLEKFQPVHQDCSDPEGTDPSHTHDHSQDHYFVVP